MFTIDKEDAGGSNELNLSYSTSSEIQICYKKFIIPPCKKLKKRIALQESAASKVTYTLSTDSKVRTTLCSVINNAAENYRSEAFI